MCRYLLHNEIEEIQMFKKKCVVLLPFVMFLFLISVIEGLALDTEKDDMVESRLKPSPTGWISNGESLGKWWLDRAKKQDPLPPELLYHIEARYSLSKATGNEEITKHKVQSTIMLRKDIVTAETMFKLKEKDMEYRGNTIKTKQRTLGQIFFVEYFDKMDLVGGLMWRTDDKKYIDNRYLCYGGLYFSLLSLDNCKVRAGAYYGYTDIEYQEDELAAFVPNEDFSNFDSDLIYLDQKLDWSITESIHFSEKFSFRQYLKDTDYYHWNLNLGMEFSLTKNISLTCSYEVDYDVNKLDEIVKGLERKDTELDFGIKVSF